MNFFRTIKKSVYNPGFYEEVLRKSFFSSLKYFFTLSLLLSAVIACCSIFFIPKALDFVDKAGDVLLTYYPSELVVTIEDGKASTNVEEPYFLPIPIDWGSGDINSKEIEHLIVIDTDTPFSTSQLYEYNTVVLLTKEALVTRDSDTGKIEFIPLNNIPNIIIDENLIATHINKFEPIVKTFVFFVPVFIFIGMVFVFLFRLVYLLFGALVIWIIAKVKGVRIGYGQSYRAGLHLMTPGLLFFAVFMSAFLLFDLRVDGIPFFFTVMLAITAWFNIEKATSKKRNENGKGMPALEELQMRESRDRQEDIAKENAPA
jgi:hypothetical protein